MSLQTCSSDPEVSTVVIVLFSQFDTPFLCLDAVNTYRAKVPEL